MLYLYYGNDEKKVRARLNLAISKLSARAPQALYARITEEEAETVDIGDLLATRGLFYPKSIIVLDGLLQVARMREEILSLGKDMAESEHVFFIVERSVSAPVLEKLKKSADKVERHDTSEIKKRKGGVFALSDAFFRRDAKEMWISYQKALIKGEKPEAILGILFWGAKAMALAEAASSEESGLKPFVYGKAKSARGRYAQDEFTHLLRGLAVLPHEARRSGEGIEYALERFILGMPLRSGGM